MVTAVIVIHIIVCIALVIVVLLQQGKGADVGAVFGGSSQTVFGAGGASSPLFKLTWTFALLFALTSLFLAYSSTKRISGSIFEDRKIPIPFHATVPPGVPPTGGSASKLASPVVPEPKPVVPAPAK
ncbi:MAG TPA: preprotein translocase subunit SecG [Candidatus Binataceae bacterium]|jgi:preprotein translocase subunit SecG|nr:preprotein translocase subunit SecG [Candidatus Binataceae bacterium]